MVMIKTKLLFDECVSIRLSYKTSELDDYMRSVDVIGSGAKDEEVFELAKKLNRVLVTSDIKFTLKILLDNYPVCFQKNNGERYFIKPKVKKMEKLINYNDYITRFSLKEEKIIIP